MHRTTTIFVGHIIVILFTATALGSNGCISQCKCTKFSAQCIGKGLRTVPKGIPLTVREINLSNNPQIRIPNDYFLQFKNLNILVLVNCGQKGPLYLPWNITYIALYENHFTEDALRKMLSTKLTSLKSINVGRNHLSSRDIEVLLEIFPKGLQLLNINYNSLAKLDRAKMRRFKNIRTLHIEYCSVESVESNAFDDLEKLSLLKLNGNKLRTLPVGLFKFNLELSALHLKQNELEEFNSTILGLKAVQELRLSNNKIATFDIRNLKPSMVLLNDNNIQKLETNIFHSNTVMFVLSFNNNNIREISRNVFHGVKNVGQLLLNNNDIKSLPKNVFQGMVISNIFLQNNKFSNLSGVFRGMKMYPYALTLMKNTNFTCLDGKEFENLPRKSKLYLSCDKFTRVVNLSELKANVECSPKADEVINTAVYDGFSCNGYRCKRLRPFSRYKCTACRPGYHSSCKNVLNHQSVCIQCPPGSFYQDEPASIDCKTCRPGQFVSPERSPGTDASDCRTCPQGTNTTMVAGTRACNCLHGYYRWYRFGPCYKCTNDGFNCSQDYLVIKDGYWMTWQGTKPRHTIKVERQNGKHRTCEHQYKAYNKNLDIKDDSYDRDTMQFNCQMPLPIKCPMSGSCVGGGIKPICSQAYTGVLCGVCKRGYSRQFNQCIQCPQRVWAVLQFIGHIALFALLCFIISLTDKINFNYDANHSRTDHCVGDRTLADIILSSLKIIVGFYQVLLSIVHELSNVHWPETIKTAISILQYIQFQVIKLPSLRCINSEWKVDAIDEFWIILIFIIIIPILAVIYYFIKSLYIHYQYSSPSEAKRQRYVCGRNCIKFVALFLFVSYTLISRKIVEILPISCHTFCTAKQNGTCVHSMSFLRSDYSIPCPTMADHKATLITGYFCLVIPLGLPVLLFMLLRSYRPREKIRRRSQITRILVHYNGDYDIDENCCSSEFRMSTMNDASLFGDSTPPMMLSALRFTNENYYSAYWYWEVTEMIRKLLMTVGIVLFLRHTKIGFTCIFIIAMIFAILHALMKPIKSNFESGAQFLSLILIPLNLAFGAVLQSQKTQSPSMLKSEQDSLYLSSMIVILNSALIFVVTARIVVIIGRRIISKRKAR